MDVTKAFRVICTVQYAIFQVILDIPTQYILWQIISIIISNSDRTSSLAQALWAFTFASTLSRCSGNSQRCWGTGCTRGVVKGKPVLGLPARSTFITAPLPMHLIVPTVHQIPWAENAIWPWQYASVVVIRKVDWMTRDLEINSFKSIKNSYKRQTGQPTSSLH